VSVPLVFDPRQGHAGGRPKYAVVLVGALGAAALLVREAWAGRRPWGGNWLRWPVLGLLAWTALSAAASDHRGTALSGFPGSYDGLWTAAALAVVFAATAAAFRAGNVRRALLALWFGAGAGVLAFGLGQLQDRLFWPHQGWDWARPSIAPWTIGSTLGNPNHLASFLAILLPLGVVLAVVSHGRTRTAVVAVGVVLVAELGVTTSRGGWAATAAGTAFLAALFGRELRRHRSAVLRVAGPALALALVAAVVVGAAGAAERDIGSLARAGPGSTVDLRLEVWGSAWRVAVDHPLVGVGPDVFPVVFPGYASERFSSLFGPFTVANGAHDIFLNTAADLGLGGLLAFLLVLGTAARGLGRSWARLSHGSATAGTRERRLLLGGVTAALVAYLVQAAFDTQEVSLSLCFWALLGLAVALSHQVTPGPPRARS
jgi:O-antigen ligase